MELLDIQKQKIDVDFIQSVLTSVFNPSFFKIDRRFKEAFYKKMKRNFIEGGLKDLGQENSKKYGKIC